MHNSLVSFDVAQLNFKERRSVLHEVKQVSVLNVSPGHAEGEKLHHVDILLEGRAVGVLSVLKSAVESRNTSTTSKSNDVSRVLQIPVLVGPHLARCSNTSSGLINNERNAMLLGQSSELFIVRRGSLLAVQGSDGLNNNSSNVLRLSFAVNNDLTHSIEASLLFFSVSSLVLGKRVSKVRERSNRPVIGRDVEVVGVGVASTESGD